MIQYKQFHLMSKDTPPLRITHQKYHNKYTIEVNKPDAFIIALPILLLFVALGDIS